MDTGLSNKTIGFALAAAASVIILAISISGCGERCTQYLHVIGAVPDTTIQEGQSYSYDLFKHVWQMDGECDGYYSDPYFPAVRIDNMDPDIVKTRIDSTSILRVFGLKKGKAQIIIFATGSYSGVADAVHFTVAVK